ncbi:hypothetical protein C6V83_18100 [Gordonia iterans]|uniref:Major capsid protein n=1 Tax=Gordonia iterans TaxID=1004901 RepID=A0A2S0KJS6_9ACTN|nr:major capsid protein [Gordonia iterans]AVM01891.1 hypothetical protein C6V83_18100 [Gordonia iterans]
MAITLQSLLDDASRATDPADRKGAVKAALSGEGVDRAQVDGMLNEAVESFQTLNDSEPTTKDEVLALELLAEVIGVAREVTNDLDAQDAEIANRRSELAAQVLGDDTSNEAADADEQSETPDEGDGDAGAEVVAEAEAVAAEAAAPAGVTAAARMPRIDLAAIKAKAPADTEPAPGPEPRAVITAAAGGRDTNVGQRLDLDGMVAAAISKIESMPRDFSYARGETRPSNINPVRVSAGIAQIRGDWPAELVASGQGADDNDVIENAVNQARLPGGGIVAAGGWCAPSETIYELAPLLADANAGLYSFPEIQAKRGGIRTTTGVDFASVWGGNVGLIQTEAQAIANTAKVFYRPGCPEFTERRLDVIYSGLEVGFLQDNAYPEVTRQTIEGVMAVHAHRVNASSIARAVAQSTEVDLTTVLGPSAAGSVLNGLELQIVDIRYKYRMPENATIEVKAPFWLKPVIRADLALRAGDGSVVDVSDAEITAFFAKRGAVVEFGYDWQDAYSTNPAAGFGKAAALTAFPTSVDLLMYPAGTFVRARGEVVNLDTVYDSENLAENDYLRLFLEEKIMVHKRAYESRLVKLPLAVNGATGSALVLDGNGKVVPVEP